MMEKQPQTSIQVELNESEIDYLLACGSALLQNLPEQSLPTYCDFSKVEIIKFGEKIYDLAVAAGMK